MYESSNDNVSHPSHYKGADGLEAIDVIRSFTGPHYVGYLHGNAIKYILRYEHKGGIEDIEKAIWYLTELKEYLEKEEALKVDMDIKPFDTEYIAKTLGAALENIPKQVCKAINNTAVTEGYLNKV